jgi:hypothetical protein
MKRIALAVSLIAAMWTQSSAQISYTSFDDGYYLRSRVDTEIEIPNPTSSYLSVRLRTFSPGFAGLIPDYQTDLFCNPAVGIPDSSRADVFGDFGSVTDDAHFTLGSTVRIPSGTLSASTHFTHLDRNDQSRSDVRSYPLYYEWDAYSSLHKTTSEEVGGRLASSFPLEEGASLGASYEFVRSTNQRTFDNSRISITPTSTATMFSGNTSSLRSLTHTLRLGYILPVGESRILISGAGVFSVGHADATYWNTQNSASYYSINNSAEPQELATRAVYIAAILESRADEKSTIRYAINLGLTSFSAPSFTSFSNADSGYSSMSWQKIETSSSFEGSVTDLRAGVGYQRRLGGGFTGFVAASLGHLSNSGSGTTRIQRTLISVPPPVSSGTGSGSATDGAYTLWDVRVPIGAEMEFSEYFTLRGGIEPRYRSARGTFSSDVSELGSTWMSDMRSYENVLHRLTFASQFGIAARHEDYGEISILFGRMIEDTGYWTFFARYFL